MPTLQSNSLHSCLREHLSKAIACDGGLNLGPIFLTRSYLAEDIQVVLGVVVVKDCFRAASVFEGFCISAQTELLGLVQQKVAEIRWKQWAVLPTGSFQSGAK